MTAITFVHDEYLERENINFRNIVFRIKKRKKIRMNEIERKKCICQI